MQAVPPRPAEVPLPLLAFAVTALVGGGLGMALFPPQKAPAPVEEAAAAPPPKTEMLFEPAENAEDGACQIAVEVLGGGAAASELHLHQMSPRGTLQVRKAALSHGDRYRFTDVAPGAYHLTALLPGGALAAAPAFTCRGDGERAFVRLPLPERTVRLTGRVTGFEGRPPAGAELLFEQPGGEKTGLLGPAHAPLAEDGRFSIELTPGRYSLLALAPHHTPEVQTLTVEAGEEAVTEIALDWKPEATGVVVGPAGDPLAGAEVFLGPSFDPKVGPSMVRTDDEGRFTMAVLPGRRLALTARHEGRVGTTWLDPVKSVEGHRDVTLTLTAGRTVGGYVQTQAGRPHGFGEVRWRVRSLGMAGTAKADAEGRFRIDGMPSVDVELWPAHSAIGAWGGGVATVDRPRVLLTHQARAYARR